MSGWPYVPDSTVYTDSLRDSDFFEMFWFFFFFFFSPELRHEEEKNVFSLSLLLSLRYLSGLSVW